MKYKSNPIAMILTTSVLLVSLSWAPAIYASNLNLTIPKATCQQSKQAKKTWTKPSQLAHIKSNATYMSNVKTSTMGWSVGGGGTVAE